MERWREIMANAAPGDRIEPAICLMITERVAPRHSLRRQGAGGTAESGRGRHCGVVVSRSRSHLRCAFEAARVATPPAELPTVSARRGVPAARAAGMFVRR